MYQDFVALFAADNKLSVEQLLAEQPLRFALSGNERGETLVGVLQKWAGLQIAGKRVLDAGCSFGGLVVALAKAGASVTGLESSAKLLAYAEANAFGVPNVELAAGELGGLAVRQRFPAKSFDCIFLGDALERHYEIDSLIANIDYLLADGGVVHFRTINARSARYVAADAHKKLFGLTLVAPDLAHLFKLKKMPAYYRPITTYLALFQYHGLPKHVLLDDERTLARSNVRRLSGQVRTIFAEARSETKKDGELASSLRKETTRFRDRFAFDVQSRGDDFVKVKYGTQFHSGLVCRSDATLAFGAPAVDMPEFGTVLAIPEYEDVPREEAA